jgi:hypothetical protein
VRIRPDADAAVDLDAGGATLEIRRIDDDVVFWRLSSDVFAFRNALARGATNEPALYSSR